MSEAPRLRTLSGIIYEQTSAQWDADTRIFGTNVQLVPIDGPNQGKHKLSNGINTYAELAFVEDGSSPAAGSVSAVPFLYLTSGSTTDIYRYQGQNEGKPWYAKVGETATTENPIWSVIWTDNGSGLKWYVLDGSAEVLYSSAQDTATPDLVTAWTADTGAVPLPSIALYPGPTVQDALEQITYAFAPRERVWEGQITQAGTSAPTVADIDNTLGGIPILDYIDEGVYTATLAGAFPPNRTSSFLGPVTIQSVIISGQVLEMYPIDGDTIGIMVGVVGANAGSNDILSGTYFKITVKHP